MPEPTSIQVTGNVDGSIVVGDHNFVVNNNHGTIVYRQARPQVQARQFAPQPPRAPRGFINRTSELASLEVWIASNEIVLLHGPDGMGKSSLLRQAANSAAAKAMPGGVVLIESVDVDGQALGPDDIIQRLFDALFESDPPLKVDAASARTYLSNARPLILMDEVGLAPALQRALPDLFPQGAILMAADAPFGADAQRLTIGPLPRSESLALLATRAELTLNDANRATLEKICELLGDVSLALVVAGNVLRETHTSPDAALQAIEAVQSLDRDPALAALNRSFGFAFSRLSAEEQQVLSAAALTPGISMTPEWLSAALGGVDVSAFIERLKALGLLFTNSPRLRLPPGFVAPAQRAAVLDEQTVLPRLIEFLRGAVDVQDELGNIFGAVIWAAKEGRNADVIALGRTLDSYLTLHGLWDGWNIILDYVLQAARQSGAQAAEAWALHQLGTRAIGVGAQAEALRFLRQALALRLKLDDDEGAAYTQHNITLLVSSSNATLESKKPKKPSAPRHVLSLPVLIGAAVLLVLFLLSVLIIFGWQLLRPRETATPVPTETPILVESTLTVPPTLEDIATPTESPTLPPVPVLTASPVPTLTGGGAGELAFYSGDDNPYFIQRIHIDGSDLDTLYKEAQDPAWSPDGKWIAFSARLAGFNTVAYPAQQQNDVQIYILNIETGDVQPVTTTTGDKSKPDWSPDGQQIVFVGFDGNFDRDLYIVDAAGGDPLALTDTSEISEDNPAWSPDGSEILYDANFNSVYRQLGLVSVDGSFNQVISNPDELIRRDMIEPCWSPNGTQIAFASNVGGDAYNIYTMTPNGAKLRAVNTRKFSESDEHSPAWSPDGGWIAFTSTLNGPRQLFIVQTDGSAVQPIVTGDVAVWEPDWRP